jgi:hypothetical protein
VNAPGDALDRFAFLAFRRLSRKANPKGPFCIPGPSRGRNEKQSHWAIRSAPLDRNAKALALALVLAVALALRIALALADAGQSSGWKPIAFTLTSGGPGCGPCMAMLTAAVAAAERELAPEPATSSGWRPRHVLPRAPGASHGLFQRELTSPPTAAFRGGAP